MKTLIAKKELVKYAVGLKEIIFMFRVLGGRNRAAIRGEIGFPVMTFDTGIIQCK